MVHKRHASMWGIRAVVGVIMIAGMFFARRWAPLQRRRIRKRLRKPLIVSNWAPVERPEDEQRLRNYMQNPPSGPIVMVGPEGCGKSILLKKVLSGRLMSVFLDLRAGTIISGDELVVAFIQQMGYLLPSTDPLSQFFIKADKKNKISGQELNAALDLMQQVLKNEKSRGWKVGIPVICIDHVHSLGSSYDLDPKKPKVSDDPSFLRLIDWVITVSDQKLAHIFFTTTTAFATLDLDRNTSFRDRRTLFYVHYPPPDQVKYFLSTSFNAQLPKDKHLTSDEVDIIVDSVGGHLRDLENILDSLLRNDGYMKALRNLITENVQFLVGFLEQTLESYFKEGKDKEGKSKKEACESYLRLWDLMVQLRDHDFVDRRFLISSIFKDKPKELDTYLVAGIIRYVVADASLLQLGTEKHNKEKECLSAPSSPASSTSSASDTQTDYTGSSASRTSSQPSTPTISTPSSLQSSSIAPNTSSSPATSPAPSPDASPNPTSSTEKTPEQQSPPIPGPSLKKESSVILGPSLKKATESESEPKLDLSKPTEPEPTKPKEPEPKQESSPEPSETTKHGAHKIRSSLARLEKAIKQEAGSLSPTANQFLDSSPTKPVEQSKLDMPSTPSSTYEIPFQGFMICEQVYIAAGSPRMRTSFGIVLSDPHLIEQRADIVRYLKKQKLKDKEKELDEKRKFWLDELGQFSERVDGMIRHSAQWREVVGPDSFSKKVDQALMAETQALDFLRNAEEELSKIRHELEEI